MIIVGQIVSPTPNAFPTAAASEESHLPLIAFFLFAVCLAALFHWRMRRFIIASLLAAFLAAVAFQIVGYFVLGYLDPFVLIALVVSMVLAFAIAVVVGLLLRLARRERK